MTTVIQKAQEVKKALASAAAVLVALQGASGTFVPETARGWIGTALSVLATFGIVYQAENKPV